MDNIKKLETLVLRATSDSCTQIQPELLHEILQLTNPRVDM